MDARASTQVPGVEHGARARLRRCQYFSIAILGTEL